MARRDSTEMSLIRDKWRERIFDPEFREKSFKDQGAELGVTSMTIGNWRREINPERWQQILDMTRQQAAGPTLRVDDALLRKALSGDVQACKLWYEIHGWSPKQNVEVSRGPDVELTPEAVYGVVQDALKMLTPEQKAKLLSEGGIAPVVEQKKGPSEIEIVPNGVVEGNVERLEGPGEGGDDIKK